MKSDSHRALFEHAADAIIAADLASGRVALANARAEEILGRTATELATRSYLELFDEDTRRVLRPPRKQGPTEPTARCLDGAIVRPDGTRCPVDIGLSMVSVGKRTLLQLCMRDATARSRTETQDLLHRLEAQNAELRAAQARLIEHDRVRTEFLGMMSHELRTPVNILIGYAHMLLESVAAGDSLPPTERAGILRRMVAGGHTLSELVEDTLSVLRLDAGALQLDVETVALDRLFHDLKGNDRLLRGQDAVEERWIVEPNVPEIVTDRRKLRQVITNLVGNARKFTEVGQIEVCAEAAGSEGVRITVRDTGCGIDEDHLPTIFDLYRQAPNGQAHDGCGIGLYIVRRYLEMLQGSVRCVSKLGEGTTFTIELPLRIQPPRKDAAPAAGNGQAAGAAVS